MKNRYILFLLTFITSPVVTRNQEMKLAEFYKNKPVLVTGGCGFIGSHIAQKLVELGARVTIIDDLSTGSLNNIQNINNNITFLQKSIVDFDACLQATENNEIIFHLAAFISVPQSMQDPTACHRTNIDGTFNLLEAARRNQCRRFVLSSSAAVYGPNLNVCTETTPCAPTSPYGLSKLIGELYCKEFTQNFNIETVMLRYFNVYGPRQNPNGAYTAVVAKFTDLMKQNKPVTIFGDGTQTRDFIPVEKVAKANLLLGMAPIEKVNGEVFNIATGNSMNLLELVDQLKKDYPGYNQEIIFKPARAGDIKHSRADCTKFTALCAT